MQYKGTLVKMKTEYSNPIQYYLIFEDSFIHMNSLLSKHINIEHVGFECLSCGASKKIFKQGFCYDCAQSSASAGDWIMRPELSTAHLNIEDRDLAYEKSVQLQPHIVYLAWSSGVKVGVTRKTQVPYRWIDQGATAAIALVEVPNRYLAGITEVALKNYFADKTHWIKMLQDTNPDLDLVAEKIKAQQYLPLEVLPYVDDQNLLNKITYPVIMYPLKIKSLNLTKNPNYSGKLVGMKGQYLIFEDGTVFNVRSSEGFVVTISV